MGCLVAMPAEEDFSLSDIVSVSLGLNEQYIYK